jgi:hypothetical protein
MYLKITNLEENHHGLQYHYGLIIDPIPFKRKGSCVSGGIYFTTPEFICSFIYYGPWVREVTIPEDAEMVQDPEGDKWRASKVILSSRKDLREVDTWKWLVENGADIHADNDMAIRVCAEYGHLEIIKYLVEKGANIHALYNYALRTSVCKGHLEVVKYLIKHEADISTHKDNLLRMAILYNHTEMVEYLKSCT